MSEIFLKQTGILFVLTIGGNVMIIVESYGKKKVKPYQIPGKLLYREKLADRVRLYVSNKPATHRAIYEVPMINVLKRVWPMEEIHRNFSVVDVGEFGVRFLFELDAIAFHESDVYVIEIKNKAVKDVRKLLLQMWSAVAIINNWYSQVKKEILRLFPIIYFREKTEENQDIKGINVLFFSDVLESSRTKKIIDVNLFEVSYPTEISQEEFQRRLSDYLPSENNTTTHGTTELLSSQIYRY